MYDVLGDLNLLCSSVHWSYFSGSGNNYGTPREHTYLDIMHDVVVDDLLISAKQIEISNSRMN